MRLGIFGRRPPPHKITGYGLIAGGALVMFLSMPLSAYVAILGALLAYAGYTLRGR